MTKQTVKYCPYCGSIYVFWGDKSKMWTCVDCQKSFIVEEQLVKYKEALKGKIKYEKN